MVTYLTFRNDFVAAGALNESPAETMKRAQVLAIAHTRIRRQTSIKDSIGSTSSSMSDAFKYLVIGMSAMGVVSLLMVAVLVVVKGEP